jgi:UDP-N-acetylmuramate--alanine ligase
MTRRLETAFGITVREGHAGANISDADVVVYSSAVRQGNPEVLEAQRRGIPVIPRAEMIAELMRLRSGIAVAGSHGKTTTTSMIALTLERAGLDPTAVIGGRLSAFGSNARLGQGEYMVVEADESDRSFLMLSPAVAVITNIDREHMESYASFAELQQAFADFANRVPFYGAVVACADDPHLAPVLPRLKRRARTYGLDSPSAEFVGRQVEVSVTATRCEVHRRRGASLQPLGMLELQVPGRHNLQNALAAIAVADELGVPFERASAALSEFQGAERRFQRLGEVGGVLVVDDYGHHPTEIAAVLTAARSTLGRRLVVVFQPHRYSRTQQLFNEFGPSLKDAELIVLTDIYAAGEDPIDGVSLDTLGQAISFGSSRPTYLARTLDDAVNMTLGLVRPGDAVITLGAGSIGTLPQRLLDGLRFKEGR